ncbi:MAG: hypothetical protein CSA54_06015 [Gammaproteobacteria bacterium]|nr:MAG: hypothetical protein CSA54_06015 [Gammaproteobacteria bacterium]
MRKAVLSRDSHRCSFPGCGAEHHLEMHHITPWYQDPRAGPPGETGVDNLMTLCSYHHRLLHEGGYSAQQVGRSGKWQVQFFGPDRLPLTV